MIAELFYGAAKSSKPDTNRRKVEEVVRAIDVLPITIGSAARFGTLKQELGSRGRVKADTRAAKSTRNTVVAEMVRGATGSARWGVSRVTRTPLDPSA